MQGQYRINNCCQIADIFALNEELLVSGSILSDTLVSKKCHRCFEAQADSISVLGRFLDSRFHGNDGIGFGTV
jgi:hypothetical protein